jgi:hypothetical protein
VEPWRIVATALLAVAGVLLVLVIMAKVRDNTSSSGQVLISGVVTFTALVLLGVLMLTVLPALLTWGIVIVAVASVSVMLLAS